VIKYLYFELAEPTPIIASMKRRLELFKDVHLYLKETQADYYFNRWHAIEENGKLIEIGSMSSDYPGMLETENGFKVSSKDFITFSRFVSKAIEPLIQTVREHVQCPTLPSGSEVWTKDGRVFLSVPKYPEVEIDSSPQMRELSFSEFWGLWFN